jgi:predicted porin
MKKHLIAAAVAAAFAVPAMAQVTVYGKANMGINKASGAKAVLANGPDGSSSRLGFRGTEDLGGGLSASFLFEHGLSPDTGAADAVFWQRSAWVGLKGGFGEVRVGRQYTLGFLGIIGQMPSTASAVDARIWGGAGGNGFAGTPARNNDQIQYHSPTVGGLQLRLSTQLTGDAPTGESNEVGLVYAAGPISAAVNYHKVDSAGSESNTSAFAQYNFGPARVAVGYIDVGSGANAGDGFWGRITAPVGAASLFAGFGKNNDNDRDAFEVGAFYSLSKRTRAYAIYSSLDVPGRAKQNLSMIGLDHNF